MHPFRRLIWTLVLALALFIIIVMITVPSRPAWVGSLPMIGSYLNSCASGPRC